MNKFATQNEMNYRRKSNTMTKLSALLSYAGTMMIFMYLVSAIVVLVEDIKVRNQKIFQNFSYSW